ncbi:MAG: hypothetical protein LM523_02625, partial [Candidatus Contendobacter sp.]|nr:hypothetical protein [Candidatus Contendobacter sp.]
LNPALALIRQLNLLRNGIEQESLVQLESELGRQNVRGRRLAIRRFIVAFARGGNGPEGLPLSQREPGIQVKQEYGQGKVKAPFQGPTFRAG